MISTLFQKTARGRHSCIILAKNGVFDAIFFFRGALKSRFPHKTGFRGQDEWSKYASPGRYRVAVTLSNKAPIAPIAPTVNHPLNASADSFYGT